MTRRAALFLFLASLLTAQATAPEVEITNEPHHHLTLENKSVRVFNVEVPPHADTLMHWHRHDYIYVTLGASQIENDVKGKPPATVKLQDGETHFSPATFAHIARNLSGQPFRNVTIEILEDDSLRNSPAIWDPKQNEDRALNLLPAGTQQILFVKDNIRASEFELQPNAAIPVSSQPHPTLLVALTDLDLFTNGPLTNDPLTNDPLTNDPRTHGGHEPSPKPHHFNSGDSTWLPVGLNHPIVNAGAHTAKFVTLEFP